jgi:hypothetical protein
VRFLTSRRRETTVGETVRVRHGTARRCVSAMCHIQDFADGVPSSV